MCYCSVGELPLAKALGGCGIWAPGCNDQRHSLPLLSLCLWRGTFQLLTQTAPPGKQPWFSCLGVSVWGPDSVSLGNTQWYVFLLICFGFSQLCFALLLFVSVPKECSIPIWSWILWILQPCTRSDYLKADCKIRQNSHKDFFWPLLLPEHPASFQPCPETGYSYKFSKFTHWLIQGMFLSVMCVSTWERPS